MVLEIRKIRYAERLRNNKLTKNIKAKRREGRLESNSFVDMEQNGMLAGSRNKVIKKEITAT